MEKDANSKRIRSRHAAQYRRLNENSEFEQLSAALPIASAISSQLLDKASIVRLTISCLRLYQFADAGYPSWLTDAAYDDVPRRQREADVAWRLGACILDALDGFLLCCAMNGDVLYVSETISICLGLSQVDMLGMAIYDYVHKDDWPRWQHAFRSITESAQNHTNATSQVEFCLRMRSTLTKRAGKDVLKSAMGFKVVHIHMSARLTASSVVGVTCLGVALPGVASSTIRLDQSTFSITTSMNLCLHYIDPRGEDLLNRADSVGVAELKGMSLYQLVHAQDVRSLALMHVDALKMGATSSQYLRLLRRGGDCLWVEMTAVRIHKQKARGKFDYITCRVTVLSRDPCGVQDMNQCMKNTSLKAIR